MPTVGDKLKSDRLWAVGAYLALAQMGSLPFDQLALAAAVVGVFILGKSWRPASATGDAGAPKAGQDAP
ncbi:MAG: hypothetical protein V3S01_02820 [Dehalococcoidia bacterium]